MNDARTIEIDANGLKLVAYEKGEGPLIICQHGFPDHPRSFRHQVDPLVAAGYRVVVPYLRGYAPSEAPADGAYQIAALARDLIGIVDALGEERATLFGHDWGAIAGYAAMIKAPERWDRFISVAVPYGPAFGAAFLTSFAQLKRSWYVFFFQTPIAEAVLPADDCAFVRNLWADWSPGWEPPKQELDTVCEMLGRPEVATAAIGYYRAMIDPAYQKPELAAEQELFQIAPIEVSTLYIHGADDGCLGVETAVGMEDSFPAGLTRLLVEGAGHFVHQEKPDAVNRAVLDFLKA